MQNASLILEVIESIRNDPNFNMAKWTNCACGHIHKVIHSDDHSDYTTALKAIGVDPNPENTNILFGNDDHKTKESVMAQLYHLSETGQVRRISRPEESTPERINLITESADVVPSDVG